MNVVKLLTFASEQGASDLHICAGAAPIVRIDGQLQKLNVPIMEKDAVESMVMEILTTAQKEAFSHDHEIDFSTQIGNSQRYRVNVYQQLRGIGAAFRVINEDN